MQAQRDAHLRAGAGGTDHRDRPAVRQQQVVHHLDRGAHVLHARRVAAFGVAEEGGAPGLVVRDPVVHAVAQAPRHERGVVDEGVHGGTLHPAAFVLQGLRQVPVVERGPGLEAALEHAVDQAVVEVQPCRQRRAAAAGLDARPGDREAVGVDAQRPRQVQILGPVVEVVAGHGAAGAVADAARLCAETVPDRLTAPALVHCALDLVRGGGTAPAEGSGKIEPAQRRSGSVVQHVHRCVGKGEPARCTQPGGWTGLGSGIRTCSWRPAGTGGRTSRTWPGTAGPARCRCSNRPSSWCDRVHRSGC